MIGEIQGPIQDLKQLGLVSMTISSKDEESMTRSYIERSLNTWDQKLLQGQHIETYERSPSIVSID